MCANLNGPGQQTKEASRAEIIEWFYECALEFRA